MKEKKNLLQRRFERVVRIYSKHAPMETNKIIARGLVKGFLSQLEEGNL